MVRSVYLTLGAIALCAALFIFTGLYVDRQLDEFHEAVETLYVKVENDEATTADGEVVRILWQEKKSRLQVFVPHNDISYIDYWLNEACSFIKTGNKELALGNLEVVSQIALTLPAGYALKLENVF